MINRYKLLDYKREDLEKMVKDGLINPNILRDYDILLEKELQCLSANQLSIKHGISRVHVWRIVKAQKKW